MFSKKRSHRKRTGKPLQEVFDKTLRDALRKDPQLAFNLGLVNASLRDVIEKASPKHKRMMELDAELENQALEMIKSTPQLWDRLRKTMIRRILVGEKGNIRDIIGVDIGNGDFPPLVPQVINAAKYILIEMDDLANQESGKAIGNALVKATDLVASEDLKRLIHKEPTILLVYRRRPVLVSHSQFHKLMRMRLVRPVGRLVVPEQTTKPAAEARTDSTPGGVPEATLSNVLSWEGKSVEAAHFVEELKRQVLAGQSDAQQLWNLLLTGSYRQIMLLLRSCKISRRDRVCVKSVRTPEGRDWIDQVVALVRQAAGKEKRK